MIRDSQRVRRWLPRITRNMMEDRMIEYHVELTPQFARQFDDESIAEFLDRMDRANANRDYSLDALLEEYGL